MWQSDCPLTSLESWMPSGRSRCWYIISTQIKIPHSRHQGQLSHVKKGIFQSLHVPKGLQVNITACLLITAFVTCWSSGSGYWAGVGIYSLPNFVVLSWDLLTMLEPLSELPLDYIDLKALPLKNVILLPFATAKTISDTIYLAILPVCSFASNFIVISKVIRSTYLPTLELLAICLLPFSDGSHGQVRFVLYTKTRRTFGYQCNLVLWKPSKVSHQTALLAHTWRMPDTWPVGIMKGIRGPVSWKWLVRLVSTRHFLYWDLSDN